MMNKELLAQLTTAKLLAPNQKEAQENSLAGKIVALYFSAHWCSPCKIFTPHLAKLYSDLPADVKSKFEILFVSRDRDEEEFTAYQNSMTFKSLMFQETEEMREALMDEFGIKGIPTVVILNTATGEVISKQAKVALDRSAMTPPAQTISNWVSFLPTA